MKKILLKIFILTLLSTNSKGADNYIIGDTLFVWAKSGLNLREGPGTDNEITSILRFGEELMIIEKTDITYNLKGILPDKNFIENKNIDPLIFRGNWVKVVTEKGKIGFIIDQYILHIEPYEIKEFAPYRLNLKLVEIDTINLNPKDNDGISKVIEKKFSNDIKLKVNRYKIFSSNNYTFPHFSIEEVLIMLSSSWDNFKSYRIRKNWKDELQFTDGMCVFFIQKYGNNITVFNSCSC